MPQDVSLDILNLDQTPWKLPERRTTTFILLLPHKQTPTENDVVAAAERVFGPATECAPANVDGDLWGVWVESETHPEPLLVSAFPTSPNSSADDLGEEVKAARWAIRMESLLDPADLLGSFARLLKFAVAIRPGTLALLDVEADRWHTQPDLDSLAASESLPPIEQLWTIHVNGSEDSSAGAWLHTHGLWRCGLPELELLAVPDELVRSGVRLLNLVAEHLIDYGAPPVGSSIEIGSEIDVALMPWESAAAQLTPEAFGSINDRAELDAADEGRPHHGTRAVVIPREGSRMSPSTLLQRISNPSTALYRSPAASKRMKQLAQATWPTFAAAFAHFGKAGCSIKVGFDVPVAEADDTSREHLWLEVLSIEPDAIRARLLHEPHSNLSLSKGMELTFASQRVSEWTVESEFGVFSPRQAPSLARLLQRSHESPTSL